ncbi:hypothetical protein D770_10630 [Flammeovirgaceae bacterium 311]|nr:hypothetical protein D770_10630 [Flammeovirgaceae bacterium 311]
MRKLLLTLILLAFSTVMFAQTLRNGSDKGLNLRSEPSTNASVLTSIPPNAKVTVVDTSNSEWTKVKYDGKTGYVASKYLSEENNPNRSNNNSNNNNNSSAKNNNSSSSSKSSSSNSNGVDYNTGIGVRLGNWESGLTVKHFFKGNAAIEGIISSGWLHRGTRITGLYEVQKPLGGNGFYWFWGVGAHVGFYNERYWNYNNDCKDGRYWHKGQWYPCDGGTRTTLGIDGIIGLEYKFPQAPFTLGIDFKPSIDLLGWGRHYGDGAFTTRYVF